MNFIGVVRRSISTVAVECSRKLSRRSGAAVSATTDCRYVRASSNESPEPAFCSTGLAGNQKAPPDRAVEPPTYSVFSTIREDKPSSQAARTAAMPVPDPTTRRSTVIRAGVRDSAVVTSLFSHFLPLVWFAPHHSRPILTLGPRQAAGDDGFLPLEDSPEPRSTTWHTTDRTQRLTPTTTPCTVCRHRQAQHGRRHPRGHLVERVAAHGAIVGRRRKSRRHRAHP